MQKKSLVLIICGVVSVIAVLLLIVYIAGGGLSKTNQNKGIVGSNAQPIIDLSIDPTGTTDGTVTISVKATVSSGAIKKITLPNGQEVTSANAKYEVSKNGDYSFVVTTEAGVNVTKSITVDNISEISADNPYIPAGFAHVEGTDVDTGFIIEDEFNNQFVWVPISSGTLIRNTMSNSQYDEIDSTATGLNNSVSKYYGFYIARFEASKNEVDGKVVAASQENVMPWANVTYEDAYDAALNAADAYGYTGVSTAIANSYAWDSTLSWINESVTNYSSNTSYGNYSGTILKTGATEMDNVNSICDMAGNLREWTTEVFYPEIVEQDEEEEEQKDKNNNEVEEVEEETVKHRVVRGGSANINKVANSHTGNPETMSDAYWGFRMILYKD